MAARVAALARCGGSEMDAMLNLQLTLMQYQKKPDFEATPDTGGPSPGFSSVGISQQTVRCQRQAGSTRQHLGHCMQHCPSLCSCGIALSNEKVESAVMLACARALPLQADLSNGPGKRSSPGSAYRQVRQQS